MKTIPLILWLIAMATGTKCHSAPVNTNKSYSWQDETWASANKPYRLIRNAIEQKVQQGKKAVYLEHQYRSYAAKQPENQEYRFRWLYAAYLSATTPFNLQKTEDLSEKLNEQPPVGVYEWLRLKFLVEARLSSTPQLITLGDRLIRRDPNDPKLRYELTRVLSRSSSIADIRRAVLVAKKLIAAYPKEPQNHLALGAAYKSLWLLSSKLSDSKNAVSSYETFLRLAKKDDAFREMAKSQIKWLKDHTDKNGRYKSHRPYDD